MLIGRKKELQILLDELNGDSSSFVAVYGRRRVGKTYLIDSVLSKHYVFSTTGVYPKKKKEEIDQFIISLKASGLSISKKNEPKKWSDAFELLKAVITRSKNKKKVVFLDELAWLSSPNTEFLSALGGFWNGWASKRNDVMLVVCASAASWMTDNLIHNKGGLYQRLTSQIHLQPFSLSECEQMAQYLKLNYDRYSIIEGYMILGGIPSYWTKLNKSKSLSQNIDSFFAGPNPIFANEFTYLYSSLFENATPYIDIIKTLGKQKKLVGMKREEIINSLKVSDTGRISKYLKELEDCGFIRRYHQFGKKEREACYQLIDNYTVFYFKFLDQGVNDSHFYSNSIDLPSKRSWSGTAFERVCFWNIEAIKKALGITNILNDISSFKIESNEEKGIYGSQIDLVIERRDRIIDLCEMKYSSSEYVIDKEYDKELRRKRDDFKRATGTKYSVNTVMITTFGLFENAYSRNISNSIDMDDLFGE